MDKKKMHQQWPSSQHHLKSVDSDALQNVHIEDKDDEGSKIHPEEQRFESQMSNKMKENQRRLSSQLRLKPMDSDTLQVMRNKKSVHFGDKDDEGGKIHSEPDIPRIPFKSTADVYDRIIKKVSKQDERRKSMLKLSIWKAEKKKDLHEVNFEVSQSTEDTALNSPVIPNSEVTPSIPLHEEQFSDSSEHPLNEYMASEESDFQEEKVEKEQKDKKKMPYYMRKDFGNRDLYDSTVPKDDNAIKHILRLREKLNWKTELTAQGFGIKKTKELRLKTSFMESLHCKDDGEYVYGLPRNRNNCRAPYNPYEIQVVSANEARMWQQFWVITASFVSKVTRIHKNEEIELTPVMEWLVERNHFIAFHKFSFFSKFRMRKSFITWKNNVQRSKTDKSKLILHKRLFWADKLFQRCLLQIRNLCENANDLKKGNSCEDNPSVILLVKLDQSHTYTLSEFCEAQFKQTIQALKQVEELKETIISVIKNTFLQVAEKRGIKSCFENEPLENKIEHIDAPVHRRLIETFSRFLKLVDYIFQEMIRQLVKMAVKLFLDFLSTSSKMRCSTEKKNKDLIKAKKNSIFKLPKDLEDKKGPCEMFKNLNLRKDSRNQNEAVFEVHIYLKIPKKSHEETDFFETPSHSLKEHESFHFKPLEPLAEMKLKSPFNISLKSIDSLFAKIPRRTRQFGSEGKYSVSKMGEKYSMDHDDSQIEVPEFHANLFLTPNRLEFSEKIQEVINNFEKSLTHLIPFSQDQRLFIFSFDPMSMQVPSEEELKIQKRLTRWPDYSVLFDMDLAYQNKIVDLLTIIGNSMAQVESYSRQFLQFCTMVEQAKIMSYKMLGLREKLTSKNFRDILDQYTDYFRDIVYMPVEKRINMIKVVSLEYQSSCLPFIQKVINICHSLLESVIQEKNTSLFEVIQPTLLKLNSELTSIEEFVEHLTFLDYIASKIPSLDKEYHIISQMYSITKRFNVTIAPEQISLLQVVLLKYNQLKSSFKFHESNKDKVIIKFKSNLDEYMVNLQNEVKDLRVRVSFFNKK